jgi:hypothetical protein
MKKIATTISIFLLAIVSVASVGGAKFDHSPWNKLLQKHVSVQGNVNYDGFKGSVAALDLYLSALSSTNPGSDWSRNDVMGLTPTMHLQ